MGLDALSFTTPARVKVLVIPVGRVKQSRLGAFVRRLQQQNVIRLGDISPDGRADGNMFSPLAFPDGLIHYDISTSFSDSSYPNLVPFEIYRIPLVIIGVADARETHAVLKGPSNRSENLEVNASTLEDLSIGLGRLQDDYPSALVHQLFLFDSEPPTSKLPNSFVAVPPKELSRSTTIKTILCDVAALLLAEMASYARSLQSSSTVETPRANVTNQANGIGSALPAHMQDSSRPASVAERPRSASPAIDMRHGHRMSMPVQSSSFSDENDPNSTSGATSPPSRVRTPPNGNEVSEAETITKSPARNSSLDRVRAVSHDRHSDGFGPNSAGERERNRGKARVNTVIGALYLLAGRWPDAIKELSSSIASARAGSDYVWQAKAMDYLLVCLLMCAWAGMQFRIPDVLQPVPERPSSKSAKHSSSDSQLEHSVAKSTDEEKRSATLQTLATILPDIVHNILNLYSRAYTFTDDKIPALSYSQSTIRCAKVLAALDVSHGLNDDVLRHVVTCARLPPPSTDVSNSVSYRSKSDIASLLMSACPVAGADSWSADERIATLAAIAALLSELGCHRKKALIMKDILSSLTPALVQARKAGAAEMGFHPAASLNALDTHVDRGSDTTSSLGSDNVEKGMRAFLRLLCQSFGIVEPTSPGQGTTAPNNPPDQILAESAVLTALQQATNKVHGSQELKYDVLRTCINVCEALPDLSGVLHYSSVLLRIAGSGIAPSPESSSGYPDVEMEEQLRLANNVSRSLSAAQHLGLDATEADYWDMFLVRGIDLDATHSSNSLITHVKPELEIAQALNNNTRKNPFIHNPFMKKTGVSVEPVLVAGEVVSFHIVLQNLYDLDIVVDSIKLVSDWVSLVSSSQQPVVIGPYRTQTMPVSAIPKSSGVLKITGCQVKVRGCKERLFPIVSQAWALRADVKGRNLQPPDHKVVGEQLAGANTSEKKKSARPFCGPVAASLSIKIIERQPQLFVKSLSQPQAFIMLLNGERKSFSITLQNASMDVPSDLVLISSTDSTTTQMQQALTSKELSAHELYELELSGTMQPAIQHKASSDIDALSIDPAGEMSLDLEVFGKFGLTSGSIQIDYGFLGKGRADIEDKFYTRQLSVPVSFTVNESLEVTRCDIIPLPSTLEMRDGPTNSRRSKQTSRDEDTKTNTFSNIVEDKLGPDTPHCLLLLDFRNSWHSMLTLTLKVDLLSTSSPTNPVSIENNIAPGSTQRIPIPLPRVYLSKDTIHSPIPSLNPANKRQFVVSIHSKTSPDAERLARETFWYREEILKRLGAKWTDTADTGRTGLVDLRRGMQITPHMISALKLDDVAIHMSLVQADEHGGDDSSSGSQLVHQIASDKYIVPTSRFLTLCTTLYNRSSLPIRPLLRLQPILANQAQDVALDLHRRLLVNSTLQQPVSVLQPKETVIVDTTFLILAKGTYEWSATVEEIYTMKEEKEKVGTRKRARTGEMDLNIGHQGRSVWSAERKCTIIA